MVKPNARYRALQVSVFVAIVLHGFVFSVQGRIAKPSGRPSAPAGPALEVRSLGLPGAGTALPSETAVLPGGPPTAGVSRRTVSRSAAAPEAGLPDDDYLPRELLTAAPTPIGDVIVDYPPRPGDAEAHLSGQLTLFIDEEGHVARIRADGPPLPAALEASARQAFLRARFTPGRVEARPVRARIRIEVRFDASPISR